MEALENLFSEYLRVWIKGNTEIMETLLIKKRVIFQKKVSIEK